MTNELVARLRDAYVAIGQHYGYVACIEEAADEIERLCALLEKCEQATGFITRLPDEPESP